MSLRNEGNVAASKLVEEITNSPSRANKILSSWNQSQAENNINNKYSPEEELAFLIDNNFSKRQYLAISQGAKRKNTTFTLHTMQ